MIEINVVDASQDDPIKKVHFSDSTGNCFRSLYIDINDNLILEEVHEIQLSKSGIQSTSLVGNNYEVLAYREYLGDEIKTGSIDYKLIHGEYQKINYVTYESSDEPFLSKLSWYNADEELCYSHIINENGSGFYDANGNEIEDITEYLDQNFSGFESIETIQENLLDLVRNEYQSQQSDDNTVISAS